MSTDHVRENWLWDALYDAQHAGPDYDELGPTSERLAEMAEHITEAIRHHHKYRELDEEILGETARRLRLMATDLATDRDQLKAENEQLRAEAIDDTGGLQQAEARVVVLTEALRVLVDAVADPAAFCFGTELARARAALAPGEEKPGE